MKEIIAIKDNIKLFITYSYKRKVKNNDKSIYINGYGIEQDSVENTTNFPCCDVIFDEVIIPSEINNIPVKSLFNKGLSLENYEENYEFNPFHHKVYIQRLILPDSITSICQGAFSKSHLIREIIWPKNCTSIPANCFSFSSIEKITFKGEIKEIKERAFEYSNLSQINISPVCLSINDYSFQGCLYLKKIEIPSSVKYIGDCAFRTSGLKSFVWNNQCHTIPYKCFSECLSLKKIVIESNISFASLSFFNECPNLELLDLSKSASLCQVESVEQMNDNLKKIPIVRLPLYGYFFE